MKKSNKIFENGKKRFFEEMEFKYSSLFNFSNFIYQGAHVKGIIICKKCFTSFRKTPANFRRDKCCPLCKKKEMLEKLRIERENRFLKKARELHGDKFEYSFVVYKKSCEDVIIKCVKHNHKFCTRPHNHFRPGGGCDLCKSEKLAKMQLKHGLSKHPLYNTWKGMIQRCYNSNNAAFHNYGGRGIKMDPKWKHDFKVLFDWAMDNGFKEGLHLDRENNDGNYSPDNCRWITPKENANNTRSNKYETINGITKTRAEWCVIYNISMKLLYQRMQRGWDFYDAVSIPKIKTKKTKKYRLFEGLWSNMKGRCLNPKNKDYKNYGGRGIKVCDEWLNDYFVFERFCLENGYKKGLKLDRIDNNKDYSPDNCKFSNSYESAQNRRVNHFLTYNGETHSTSKWARIKGLKRETIKCRIERGWPVELAINAPLYFRIICKS